MSLIFIWLTCLFNLSLLADSALSLRPVLLTEKLEVGGHLGPESTFVKKPDFIKSRTILYG